MSVEEVLGKLRRSSYLGRNITFWKEIPARLAMEIDLPPEIHRNLEKILVTKGIKRLYLHQAESMKKVGEGKNIVVATPTASGKSLCYNIPVINEILQNPESCALYIFPTKALAQDQARELSILSEKLSEPFCCHTYDGDTTKAMRSRIRHRARILISNPDMLHTGILPHHPRWQRFLCRLKFVVIDEIHYYRGIFGSHLANVIRRLKRICRFYGSQPLFICCSATIANPREITELLIEEEVFPIEDNGAPSSAKHFLFYNPPLLDRILGIRANPIKEGTRLAREFLSAGVQTIVFTGSRQKTELLLSYLKDAQREIGRDPDLIRGYRGGYLPDVRREIEKGLKEGKIQGVVSTNALELGVDIGSLDASIMIGYPGTIASTHQQAGRAGRRLGTSAAILVAANSPLDQFIIRNPDYFFSRSPEHCVIDPDNLAILINHIMCSAFELPFGPEDSFGRRPLPEILDYLEEEGLVISSGLRRHWSGEGYPAEEISLRSTTAENVTIHDQSSSEEIIGEVDLESAPFLVHPEAIYIQDGQEYHVSSLDLVTKKAEVIKIEVDYFTRAETVSLLSVVEKAEEMMKDGWGKARGSVMVRMTVSSYKKIKYYTHEVIGGGPLDMPENQILTEAFWIVPGEDLVGRFPDIIRSSFQIWWGVVNLLLNVAPLFVMADRRDLIGLPQLDPLSSRLPTLYIYDNCPGGAGYSRKIYDIFEDILKAAEKNLRECPCLGGCPSCVGPSVGNEEKDKLLSLEIIKILRGVNSTDSSI